MPTFVTLTKYTQDGIEALVDLDEEEFLQQSRAEAEAPWGELKDFYLTLGEYDAVGLTSSPP